MTDMASHLEDRLRRPSGIRSLTLGDARLSFVPDGVLQLNARLWLPDATDEDWAQSPEYLDENGSLVASVGGLLVERDGRALLIDAGLGPVTVEPPESRWGILRGGALLESLAALGRSPADIEAVALTHLHGDHVGWAWHAAPGSNLTEFRMADYLVAEPEWSQRHLAEAKGMGEALNAMQHRVRTVEDDEEIFPGVHVMITPGHTPGHAAYVISAGGQRVIAFGDAFHSSIQISHPEWGATVDYDRGESEATRRNLIAELAQPNTIGFGVHFADVVFGRVGTDTGRAVWHPLDA